MSIIGPSVIADHLYKLMFRSFSVTVQGFKSASTSWSDFSLLTSHRELKVPASRLYIRSKDFHTLSSRIPKAYRLSLPSHQLRPYSSRSGRKVSEPENAEYEDGPPVSNEGMNLRYQVENGYLSWMRNTYISTLASITVMHLEACGTPLTIGAVTLLIGALNVTAGTFGYLYGMQSLYRRGYVSKIMRIACQLYALIHFIVWYIVFTLLFPTLEVVDKELETYEKSLK
ncbi:hypothetical protein DPMN_099487 [Dreissena polymorpha]|uniref:Uncharacterized protein n=2 Tax=Dreissena polymorpha TaxID=45954 RepID=A0A9D4R7P6_DREPO|nr:hypothetical protein DPMN_099487 [Dreissena polymorpha]